MGKDKQRTKGGVKSSSSSGASSLLGSTGFVGFSDVLATPTNGDDGGGGGNRRRSSYGTGAAAGGEAYSATPFYAGGDADLRVITKRLSKKDSITKHKALMELAQLVMERSPSSSKTPATTTIPVRDAGSSSSLVEGLIPFWLYIYPRLVILDDDRRVREAIFSTVLPQLLAADRKAIVGITGNHLMGPWWLAMSDTQKEVATAAIKAFESAFPKESKREEILHQASPVILGYLHDNLQLKPEEVVADTANSTQEEIDERLERITISTLLALASLIHKLNDVTRGRLLTAKTVEEEGREGLLLCEGRYSSFDDVLNSMTWKFLNDTRHYVRRAAYGVLAATSSKLGALIRQTDQVSNLALQSCGLLAEKDSTNHGAVWEAILLYFHHFPKAIGQIDCKAHLFPRLLKLIKNGFYGSSDISCPSVLPLVALIPNHIATSEGEKGGASSSFYDDVLDALWKGSKGEGEEGPYLVAIVEVATYLMVKQDGPSEALGHSLIDHIIIVLIKAVSSNTQGAVMHSLVTSLAQVERAGRERGRQCLLVGVEKEFWTAVKVIAIRLLDLAGPSIEFLGEHGSLLALLDGSVKATVISSTSLANLLGAAHDKVLASNASPSPPERQDGLEETLHTLFWLCFDRCSRPLGNGELAYVALLEMIALRIPYSRLASSTYPDAATLFFSTLLPLLKSITVEASSPVLRSLLGLVAALNLGLISTGQHALWDELFSAATAAGLPVLLTTMEVLSMTYDWLHPSKAEEKKVQSVMLQGGVSLPPLNELVSSVVGPLVISVTQDASSSSSSDRAQAARALEVRLLVVSLGVGNHSPFLAASSVQELVDHALQQRDALAIEALVEILSKGHKTEGVLEPLWEQASTLLSVAFELMDSGGDAKIRSVVTGSLDHAADDREERRKIRETFRQNLVDRLQKSISDVEASVLSASDRAEQFIRLTKILCREEADTRKIASELLRDVGLAEASVWKTQDVSPLCLKAMWMSLEAVLNGLEPHDANLRLSTLLGGDATEEEKAAEGLHQIIRAGVEVGEPQDISFPARLPVLSAFLSATCPGKPPTSSSSTSGTGSLMPSDTPFHLLFEETEASLPSRVIQLLLSVIVLYFKNHVSATHVIDWHAAYAVAKLITLVKQALEYTGQPGPINETALTRVVLPKEMTYFFDDPEELKMGTEVLYQDKRAKGGGRSGAWKRGKVAGIHRDDVEKYFTIAKAEGGETQMEFNRLRRNKPPEIESFVKGVCDGAPHLQYQEAEARPLTEEEEDMVKPVVRSLMPSLDAALNQAVSNSPRENVPMSWALGSVLKALPGLVHGSIDEAFKHEIHDWLDAVANKWFPLAIKAIKGGGSHRSMLSTALYVLGALSLSLEKTTDLWQVLLEANLLTGDGGAAERVSSLRWAETRPVAFQGPGIATTLERMWTSQTDSGVELSGLGLAAVDLGLKTVFERGAFSLPSSTKATLFRMALRGLTRYAICPMAGSTTSIRRFLGREICNRCRILAVSLIPMDNRDLDWTTHIYADTTSSAAADKEGLPSLNFPLWNADIDALLEVLESAMPCPCLHLSVCYLIRPYVRSAVVEDEGELDDQQAASSIGSKAGVDILVDLFGSGEEGRKALSSDVTEQGELAKDLQLVEKRLAPRLHRMLKTWLTASAHIVDQGEGEGGGALSLIHLLGWEGLLEAIGGDGEEAFAQEDLVTHRHDVFQMWLTWIVFLEHVDGVAHSTKLRDAYSTYISLLGAVPIIMQACFHIIRRSSDMTALELHQVWGLDPLQAKDMRQLTAYVVYRTIVSFPALVRKWWSSDCERWLSASISKFVEENVSGRIMQREIELIVAKGKEGWGEGDDEVTVRGSAVTREVIANYFKDDCTLEVMIRLPLAYPLRNVEVECSSLGVSGDKWKRWRLQIVTLLSLRDGSVVDAVSLWVRNLQKEFEGMEPCPICYSILHPKTFVLPERECKTCKNKFHHSCIFKWFNTSGKNACPLCQQHSL